MTRSLGGIVSAIWVNLIGFWSCEGVLLRTTTLDFQEDVGTKSQDNSSIMAHLEILKSLVKGVMALC